MIDNYLYNKFFNKLNDRRLLTDNYTDRYICFMLYGELLDNIVDVISHVIQHSRKYSMHKIFNYDGQPMINIIDTEVDKRIGYFLLDTLNPSLLLYNIPIDRPWLICKKLDMVGHLDIVGKNLAYDIMSKLSDEEKCWMILNGVDL